MHSLYQLEMSLFLPIWSWYEANVRNSKAQSRRWFCFCTKNRCFTESAKCTTLSRALSNDYSGDEESDIINTGNECSILEELEFLLKLKLEL
jgi:hypothetical protein